MESKYIGLRDDQNVFASIVKNMVRFFDCTKAKTFETEKSRIASRYVEVLDEDVVSGFLAVRKEFLDQLRTTQQHTISQEGVVRDAVLPEPDIPFCEPERAQEALQDFVEAIEKNYEITEDVVVASIRLTALKGTDTGLNQVVPAAHAVSA